jgi:putative ABC transport system permease protein
VLRRRRRDYAVLKALGFTRRQVLTTVGWQATITVLAPVLVGVPLGIIGGQVAWRGFARLIGVLDSAVFPIVAITVVAVLAVILTYLVCMVPAALASRVRPAAALRSE